MMREERSSWDKYLSWEEHRRGGSEPTVLNEKKRKSRGIRVRHLTTKDCKWEEIEGEEEHAKYKWVDSPLIIVRNEGRSWKLLQSQDKPKQLCNVDDDESDEVSFVLSSESLVPLSLLANFFFPKNLMRLLLINFLSVIFSHFSSLLCVFKTSLIIRVERRS